MANIHPVSPCCGAKIRRFGGRRRQCVSCEKTWRIFRHRRGRKRIRITADLARRTVNAGIPVKDTARRSSRLTLRATQHRFKRSLDLLTARTPVTRRFRGAYVLIADGLWYTFGGEDWVLYVMMLKPRRRNSAILLDPVIFKGRETFRNWKRAIESISEHVRKRILAFVSDHFSASERVADSFGFIHQLCHFHLISELQKRRGKRKWRIAGSMIRENTYQCVIRLLQGNDAPMEQKLWRLINRPDCPRKVAMIAREFLRVKDRYHAYRMHPELTIPTTSNAVESLNKLIRKRTGPLRSPDSVLQWATAFIRLRKNMTCNGSHATLKKSTKLIS